MEPGFWIAIGIVAGTGIVIGLLLGIAGKLLYTKTDDRVSRVREHLPGSNCGGCGYSGCDGMAAAIVKGDAEPGGCMQCDKEERAAICEILGKEDLSASERKVAVVRCSGTCDKTKFVYDYYGLNECHRVALVPGRGSKSCAYACTGLGSCVRACPTGAMTVVNGRAQVDQKRCVGCGACLRVCPNDIIELIPATAKYVVACKSQEKGKAVREMCQAGCIGCGICQKMCPSGAITLTNNIAHIDQSLCTRCGGCASKCPAKVIRVQNITETVQTAEEKKENATNE